MMGANVTHIFFSKYRFGQRSLLCTNDFLSPLKLARWRAAAVIMVVNMVVKNMLVKAFYGRATA